MQIDYTATVKHTLRYRFVCEQCGQLTQWFPIQLERSYTYGMRGSHSAAQGQAKAAAGAEKALRERIASLRRDVEAGRYDLSNSLSKQERNSMDKDSLFTQTECPRCRAIQSWAVNAAKQGGFGLTLLCGLGLAGLGLGAVLWIPGVAEALKAWTLMILPGLLVIGCLVGSGIHTAKVDKRLSRQQAAREKRLPEIDWNGW